MKAFMRHNSPQAFYISLAGTSYCDGTYLVERKNSPNAVIEYVVDGEGIVECDGKRFRVERDLIYFLPAHTHHRYYADPQNPFTKIFMDVRGELVDTLTSVYGLSGKYIFDGKGLKAPFERIQTLLHSGMRDYEIQGMLQGIFVEVLSGLALNQSESRHSEEFLIVKRFLDANTSRIVSARELSAVIFRSPDYCQKLFLKELGITPYEYQLSNKMHIAKTYLSDTAMSVGEISEALGYSDQHHFSNLFKSRVGVSPLAWRKK